MHLANNLASSALSSKYGHISMFPKNSRWRWPNSRLSIRSPQTNEWRHGGYIHLFFYSLWSLLWNLLSPRKVLKTVHNGTGIVCGKSLLLWNQKRIFSHPPLLQWLFSAVQPQGTVMSPIWFVALEWDNKDITLKTFLKKTSCTKMRFMLCHPCFLTPCITYFPHSGWECLSWCGAKGLALWNLLDMSIKLFISSVPICLCVREWDGEKF